MEQFVLIGYAVPEDLGMSRGIMKGELFFKQEFDLMLKPSGSTVYYNIA